MAAGFLELPRGRLARRHLAVLGASLVAAVVASPYRFSNLTHPVEVSLSPYAREWRLVGEWRSLWDPEGFGTRGPFLVLVGIALVVLVRRVRVARKTAGVGKGRRAIEPPSGAGIDWSDVALVVVTLGMAVLSRRFLPILALVLAPLLASWGQEVLDAWRPAGRRRARRAALVTCALARGSWVSCSGCASSASTSTLAARCRPCVASRPPDAHLPVAARRLPVHAPQRADREDCSPSGRKPAL